MSRDNLYRGDVLLPTAVLHEDALQHNIDVMAAYCADRGVSLAPHGKTTMAPAIFARQLAAGAWAICVATPQQAVAAFAAGVPRVVVAAEVVQPLGVRTMLGAARQANGELLCFVDSVEAVAALAAAAETSSPTGVLVELGPPGGRTGCRDDAYALEVARGVAATGGLRLDGVATFEGLVDAPVAGGSREWAEIDLLLDRCALVARAMSREGLVRGEVVVSAGGSAWFDRVVERLSPLQAELPARIVLRSGCYVTHDAGHYHERTPFPGRVDRPALRAALEVWGSVISVPEPGLAIAGLGRRNVSFDAGLPVPVACARDGRRESLEGVSVRAVNDQHAYLVDPDRRLRVGDMVGCGVSHPCTTFDKWRRLVVLDPAGDVVDTWTTEFA